MSEHKSIRDSLIEQLMSLEDIQLEIDGLIAQITEAEQKYANIEAMLQKVEVAWTQEEKSTYSNKKTLRDKERIVLAELSMFRRRLNDLLVEKLTLLQINAPQRTNVPSLEVNNMKSIITESIFSMSSASRISSDEVSQGSEYREEVSVGFATKFTQSIAALFKKPSKSTDMLVAETGKGASLEVVLGTSNSGKSTCIKQMKILLGKGFSDEDRLLAKVAIQENILDSICTLIAATVQFGLIMDGEFLDIITRLRDGIELEDNSIPLRDVKDLKRLWESKVIQNVMQKAHLLDIQENAAFFLDRIDDVTRTDYVPSDADVLNCRMESPLLIRETYFTLGQISLTLYDVGESRSQNQVRLFWAAFFQGKLNAIIFVSSLSFYDQSIVEESGAVNRMNDSIDLYCQILLNKLLSGVPIILFLNKTDLLEKKLKISPLQDHFPNYTGEVDFRKAKSFFKKRFHEQHGVANDSRDTYTHFTQCTDIITMKVVLAAVSAFVLHRAFDGDLL